MATKIRTWSEHVIEAGWLAALVVVPLYFNIQSSRIFEPDKITLIRSIALLMAAAWITKSFRPNNFSLSGIGQAARASLRKPLALPVLAIAIIYIISSLASIAPGVSWLGSYQRLQGTYSTLSYIVIFALMSEGLRNLEQSRRIVTTIVATSVPIAIYAMMQHYGLDPLPWGADTSQRVAGQAGNSIFIAAHLILAAILVLGRIINSFTDLLSSEDTDLGQIARTSIYIFIFAIELAAIFWTKSRGPMLGLAAGIFAFTLITLVGLRRSDTSKQFGIADLARAALFPIATILLPYIALKALAATVAAPGSALDGPYGTFGPFALAAVITVAAIFVLAALRRFVRWLWLSWILIAVGAVAFLAIFNVDTTTTRESTQSTLVANSIDTIDSWKAIPELARFSSLVQAEAGSGRVRVLIWEGSIDLLLPHDPLVAPDGTSDPLNWLRPLIGYGPETMYVAFNKFFPAQLAAAEARNASPDRAHNETIDSLVITGLLGFGAWQFLFVATFLFAFRYLGVISGRRDSTVFIALWLVGAVAGFFASIRLLAPEYFGIGLPFGSIAGLILYLIYFSSFGEFDQESGGNSNPFDHSRIILIAITSAIIAHLVEIHFGIAIGATRVHYFALLGLLVFLGTSYRRESNPDFNQPSTNEAKPAKSGNSSLVFAIFVVTLITAVNGFDFLSYAQPPDIPVLTLENAPGPIEIIQQSFFQNPREGFAQSPYIFVLILISWLIASLLFMADRPRAARASLSNSVRGPKYDSRTRVAGIVLGLLAIGVVISTQTNGLTSAGPAFAGSILVALWALFALITAIALIARHDLGINWLPVVGATGLLVGLPMIIAASAILGWALTIGCGFLLIYMWQTAWKSGVGWALSISLISALLGFVLWYARGIGISSFVIGPTTLAEGTPAIIARVAQANMVAGSPAFITMAVTAFVLGFPLAISSQIKRRKRDDSLLPLLVGAISIIGAIVLGSISNTRVIQADIVHKQGAPWEREASRQDSPEMWDVAIAHYERAIELAPNEDYYYLFLGRGYLEKAGSTDEIDRTLLETADERLASAQALNPFNTDHTANLARLHTRWSELEADTEKAAQSELAKSYYQSALVLSPQNSTIRNELARLLYVNFDDCDGSIAKYQESIEIDPFFSRTYFELGEILNVCGIETEDQSEKSVLLQEAVSVTQKGLEITPADPARWIQLANIFRSMSDFESAIEAFEQAKLHENPANPAWRVDYTIATILVQQGQVERAASYGLAAYESAPADVQPEIERFLISVGAIQPPAPEEAAISPDFPLVPARDVEPEERVNYYPSYPPTILQEDVDYQVRLVTTKGEILLDLYERNAPKTVNSFVFLVDDGYYNGVQFHRVLEDFMAQSGDPSGTGRGGPGYTFEDEFDPTLIFDEIGILAMANSGANTNGSQFFITFGPTRWLDGRHTIFGKVLEGAPVLDLLLRREPGPNQPDADLIISAEIVRNR